MKVSVGESNDSPLMLPWLLLSDVKSSQQAPVTFDAFGPPTMFMPPISPSSQSLPKPFRNPESDDNKNDQDWKTFFEQFKDNSAKTTAASQAAITAPNITKEKSTNLNEFSDCAGKFESKTDAKHVLNISSKHSSQQILGQTTALKTEENKQIKNIVSNDVNNNARNHKNNLLSTSCDPCLGLTELIRKKGKKQFICMRCGSTHSNCVKSKSLSSAAKQLRNFRLNRVRRAASATARKVIVICPNCGKRSHSSSANRPSHDVSYCRSLTWPLPLERIVEDETESHCCVTGRCRNDNPQTFASLFQPSTDHVAPHNIHQSPPSKSKEDSANGRINKVLIASICPSALTYISNMKRWSTNKYDDDISVRFVAMVTPNTMKSHPDLMGAIDNEVIVGRTSDNDLDNENKVIVEAAKAHQVQAVWVSGYDTEKYEALENLLKQAGISLHSSNGLRNILQNDTFPLPPVCGNHADLISKLSECKQLSDSVQRGSDVGLIDDEVSSPFNVAALLSSVVHIAENEQQSRSESYLKSLQSGEILPAPRLSSTVQIELRCGDGNNSLLEATKVSPSSFYLTHEKWSVETSASKLNDGGMLLSFDGAAYTTYFKEYSDCYEITVDEKSYTLHKSQTCLPFLQTRCDGKITEYVLSLPSDTNFQVISKEIENMNSVSSTDQLIDTSKRQSHKVATSSLDALLLVMQGWSHPQCVVEERISKAVEQLITSLSDPTLPLLQLQDAISATNGALPPPVQKHIRKEMSHYASNITSMMATFPGARIKKIITSFAKTLFKKCDQESFYGSVSPILQVMGKFSNGIGGNMRNVLLGLLREYYDVESKFQQTFQQSVAELLQSHEAEVVLNHIRSHSCVAQKNNLALQIIKSLTSREHNLSNDVVKLLGDISCLSHEDNAKVALNARQVLRKARKIPYELRYNQLDSLFLSMGCSDGDLLLNSISDVDVFEILPHFFTHARPEVRMTALEIYVRRAYTASQLQSIQHQCLSEHHSAIVFDRTPPSGQISSSVKANFDSDHFETASPQHIEVMVAFPDMHVLESYLCQVLQLFEIDRMFECGHHYSNRRKTIEKKVHRTLNVIITTTDDAVDDEILSEQYKTFLTLQEMLFEEVNLQQVNFLVHGRNENPKYFVFNLSNHNVTEDRILRHIDPFLHQQLGLKQIENCRLEVLPSTQELHMFLAGDETNVIYVLGTVKDDSADRQEISVDTFRKDVELSLLEVLDDFENLSSDMRQYPKHIIINVIKNMTTSREIIEDVLRRVFLQYEKRLNKKNVKEIEIRHGNSSDDELNDTSSILRSCLLNDFECTFH